MNRWRVATWISILAVPIALCALALVPSYLNHDAAWYLHMARVWLDGAVLYRDVVDTNPPLIVFISAAPVWIAGVFDARSTATFKIWVFALGLLATVLSISPLRRTWSSEPSRLLVAVVLTFVLFPFTKDEFGQREHIAAILTAPFVLHACLWAAGGSMSSIRGVIGGALAGFGFALKPHFLFAWLGLEASLLFVTRGSRRWRRPGALACVVTMVAYGFVVIAFVPEYRTAAGEVMAVYAGLNEPLSTLLRVPELRVWVVAAAALALLRLPEVTRGPSIVLFAVASGFLLAALLQLKGWGYHFYPFRAFVLLFFASVLASVLDGQAALLARIRGARLVTAMVIVVMVLWSARAAVRAWRTAATGYVAEIVDLLRRDRADSMALLSMRFLLFPAFPAANYADATWVLRHNSLWFLPGLYREELNEPGGDARFRTVDAMPSLERKYFAEIVDDLCARPPSLLFVEPPVPDAPGSRRSLDLIAYYTQDPRFARLFTSYTQVATVGPFVAYARTRPASCAQGNRGASGPGMLARTD